MVFFNDPLAVANHELQAVRFAVAAQERFAELAGVWRKRGIELGLHRDRSRYATIGRIGFEGRYDYGVVGLVANVASRLSVQAAAGCTDRSAPVRVRGGGRETASAGNLELKASLAPSLRMRSVGCGRHARTGAITSVLTWKAGDTIPLGSNEFPGSRQAP